MATGDGDQKKQAKRQVAKIKEVDLPLHPDEKKYAETYPQASAEDTRPVIGETDGASVPPTVDPQTGIEDAEADVQQGQEQTSGKFAPRGQFLTVGIGASAGGLDAFERFFRAMPPDSDMAFVLVPHLDPSHVTHLPDLIQRTTPMPVHLVKDRMRVQPNHVYIIPPDWLMGILHGTLHLVRRFEVSGGISTINYFLRTLAEDQCENSVAIILSGMGGDGSKALQKVKDEFGLVLAQEPTTAKYASMPNTAIETGCVDYILPPEQMPELLITYATQTAPKRRKLLDTTSETIRDHLERIFIVLRSATGHDFSSYKRTTIMRRIQRRMATNQIKTLSDYTQLLSESSEEPKKLLEDLLIGVTRFFRDPEAFEVLKEKALLPMLKTLPRDHIVRIWIPGCSGGEEPYSLAMVLRECFEEIGHELQVQIFATDIDAYAIEKARVGLYPDTVLDDIGPVRLKKFFTKQENAYRVIPGIRQMLVFAPQNVIKDPPFTKLDLLSCRNLLIYFDADLQKRLLPLFHYSLRPNGILFLGTSETLGQFTENFTPIDRKWKIYRREDKLSGLPPQVDFSLMKPQPVPDTPPVKSTALNLTRTVERLLLQRYAPPSALVDSKGQILYIHGRTGQFLEPAAGKANWNIVQMSREGLRLPLANALRNASTLYRQAKLEGVKVQTDSDETKVDVTVTPLTGDPSSGLFLVTFEQTEEESQTPSQGRPADADSNRFIAELEQELSRTREHLQTSVEELETANEELRSMNEEYQSTNEELQSSNEELNTSREELQSLNEELETVNTEYQGQLQQLQQDYIYMHDLFENIHLPIIVLDTKLRIMRFTSPVTRVINLISSDIGRPFTDIASQLIHPKLVNDAGEVMDTLIPKTVEVRSTDDCWYALTIRPIRTSKNVIAGVVIVIVDISAQKAIEEQLSQANRVLTQGRQWLDDVVDTLREGLVSMEDDLRVSWANRVFYDMFRTTPENTVGKYLYDLGNRQWDIPQLRQLLEEILPERKVLFDYKVIHSFPNVGTRTMVLNARQLAGSTDGRGTILLAIEDKTPQQENQ